MDCFNKGRSSESNPKNNIITITNNTELNNPAICPNIEKDAGLYTIYKTTIGILTYKMRIYDVFINKRTSNINILFKRYNLTNAHKKVITQ